MNCKVKICQGINLNGVSFDTISPFVKIYSIGPVIYKIGQTSVKIDDENPIWNEEFEVDFFRAAAISFVVCDRKTFVADPIIGKAQIELKDITESTTLNLPLSSSNSEASPCLSISVELSSILYTSNDIKSLLKKRIYLYLEYDPPIPNASDINPLPVELLVYYINTKLKYTTYFHIDSPWDPIGRSTNGICASGPSGPTQVHRLNPASLKDSTLFFILASSNYTGTVTINFIVTPKEEQSVYNGNHIYTIPEQIDENSPLILDRINVSISEGEIKSAPSSFAVNSNFLPIFTPVESVIKTESQEQFEKDLLTLIDLNTEAYFSRKMFPLHHPIKLMTAPSLAIVVGKCLQNKALESTIHVHPHLFMVNNTTKEISQSFVEQTKKEGREKDQSLSFNNFLNSTKNKDWHKLSLDLSKIDNGKTFVLGINIILVSNYGSVFVRLVECVSELFSNEIFFAPIKCTRSGSIVLFKISYEDNHWTILPLHQEFANEIGMNLYVENQAKNNWNNIDSETTEETLGLSINELEEEDGDFVLVQKT